MIDDILGDKMSFSIRKLEIPDLLIVVPEVFKDERGFFYETYKRSDFILNGISAEICPG